MLKVDVVPFTWHHVAAMDLRPDELGHFASIKDYIARSKIYTQRGPCFSAIVEGEGVAMCWGFLPYWQGVWEAWALTSYLVERHPIATIRRAQSVFNQIESDLQAHRLQITVKASNQLSLRFAEALKFKREGVLTSYGPDGSDYIMLARTRP
jgi:hypothetical protein